MLIYMHEIIEEIKLMMNICSAVSNLREFVIKELCYYDYIILAL